MTLAAKKRTDESTFDTIIITFYWRRIDRTIEIQYLAEKFTPSCCISLALMIDLAWIAYMVSFLQLVGFTLVIQGLFKILIDLLPDLHEARAILLGRLGRHDQALETYVYRLQDFMKAEESVHPTHACLGSH
jgi:hypothetical protein